MSANYGFSISSSKFGIQFGTGQKKQDDKAEQDRDKKKEEKNRKKQQAAYSHSTTKINSLNKLMAILTKMRRSILQ